MTRLAKTARPIMVGQPVRWVAQRVVDPAEDLVDEWGIAWNNLLGGQLEAALIANELCRDMPILLFGGPFDGERVEVPVSSPWEEPSMQRIITLTFPDPPLRQWNFLITTIPTESGQRLGPVGLLVGWAYDLKDVARRIRKAAVEDAMRAMQGLQPRKASLPLLDLDRSYPPAPLQDALATTRTPQGDACTFMAINGAQVLP